ncbi:MAG TPA: UDP-N-acetylglucosamine 2-epimerase (non-hydrolyzing) [Bacteroidales bacterium]|nr:UDP-N-acetylglucosamine 2-epimerase (non-hydrolyzing) [Bacteroidales bacterium]
MKKAISVVGARPNFIKIAPLDKAFRKYRKEISHFICHTGQHFDDCMSKIFFEELGLPRPDFYLGIGGGSHAEQTARIMLELEKVLTAEKPDLVIVPGDVNSTLAAALVASKMGIPIAHVEAGLRSFDKTMPEEINRIVTDVVSDFLFVSEHSGIRNLRDEGMDEHKIHFVGNIMIDSLEEHYDLLENHPVIANLGLEKEHYILATFHRPTNVDNPENLRNLMTTLGRLSKERPLVFPVHPRTRKNLRDFGIEDNVPSSLHLTEPLGYIEFLSLLRHAELVITDSGGIQEETTYLGVQCITVRKNTERPVTIDVGTNHLVGTDLDRVEKTALDILAGIIKPGRIPELWDGKTAKRIAEIIVENLMKA